MGEAIAKTLAAEGAKPQIGFVELKWGSGGWRFNSARPAHR